MFIWTITRGVYYKGWMLRTPTHKQHGFSFYILVNRREIFVYKIKSPNLTQLHIIKLLK